MLAILALQSNVSFPSLIIKKAVSNMLGPCIITCRGAVASWLVGIERSGFAHWPGTLCCVLEQDTSLSQCLSPPRCTWVPAN